MKSEKSIKKALIKCATGFSSDETVEEYVLTDGEYKLVKKKVTTRNIPPDIKAVKLLLDGETGDENLSDEELEEEKQKLMNLLKEKKI